MTDSVEAKEAIRRKLADIHHKDRWDDDDRREIRAIHAALSHLIQHIPAQSPAPSPPCPEGWRRVKTGTDCDACGRPAWKVYEDGGRMVCPDCLRRSEEKRP
jgi:hypothetical protein